MKKELTYTKAMAELEGILSKAKNGGLTMDDLYANVKRANELLAFCKAKIVDTEKIVKDELEKFDNKETEDDENE